MTKIFMILGEVFSFCGGYFGWDFFVNNYKFKGFQKPFGEQGARTFYMILGVFIIIVGLMC